MKLPEDELGVIGVPREVGRLQANWPKDELGVIVMLREVGNLLWKGVFGVGTVLVGTVTAEEGVLENLPLCGIEAQELYAAGDAIAEIG